MRLFVLAALVVSFTSAAPPGWSDADMLEPKDLATRLADAKSPKPVIFQVGFGYQYRSKHIPKAIYAGPGKTAEGLASLRSAVAGLSKDQEIVLYCGCCPWHMCPNMKPAFALLRELGFKRVKALNIETNFAKNWIELGYPVEAGSAATAPATR